MRTSNKIDAAKKPKNCRAVGRISKLIISAMKPTNEAAPIFFVHQTTSIKAEKPMRSQAKGKWNT
jgi:hypothetical protein